ncbi:PAPA-1-like conserved region-domain-containing protein [Lophiotrema nucula]|uniref:PAPA-1-like conserved region-domain-containing protein n=1 Tax=Lophiotrema nucula TaxID=690887 RepID=A0A6A5ZBR1_9PLEO|nr:PAPA-1-like conserved region-domain-containing protein [Lophiotrema nucula]
MPRLRSRAALTAPSAPPPTASSTRPRRSTASRDQAPQAAIIQRSSPEETRQSIHLTVKASPNKLRKATGGSTSAAKTAVSSRNIVQGKRASRTARVIKEFDSDDEEEEEDDDVVEADAMDVDEDEEDEDEDAEGEEEEDEDAEGEEDDEMEDLTPAPAPPRIVVSSTKNPPVKVANNIKPAVIQDSVEAKEMVMADDDDDEELSELDSDEEDAEGEEDDEIDAEGEEDDELGGANDEDEDEDMDSDGETPASMSRSHTPDLSKMTRRQRAMVVEDLDGSLLSLSNEAQKKKHLTAEEHAMRRAEMARRRKNLSEKRNEEEKMDTINRLLKKQPPKRGRRVIQDLAESGQEDEPEVERANPLYVRYTQNAKGTSLAIPDEWLQAPVGSIFASNVAPASQRPFGGRMVEEVS